MTMTQTSLRSSTSLFEFKQGKFISEASLKELLPTVEVTLFFAKAYGLNIHQLGQLLWLVHKSTVIQALLAGDHSTELQDYLVSTVPEDVWEECATDGNGFAFTPTPPPGEFLPQLWEDLEVQVAKSIKDVADKLAGTLGMLPGKQGNMVMQQLMKLNKQRPTIGSYQAGIKHAAQVENLVIFDVSGSMTESTVRQIVDDVVALSWKANAHLAIVSNDTFHWEPGSYDSELVLRRAQFGGTQYETLTPLLDRQWGTVICIADYDSSRDAKTWIKDKALGTIDTVLDISLVNRPTFLSECVGQLANEVRPLLIGNSSYVLRD